MACNRCKQLEHEIERYKRYMDDYIGLANVVHGFYAMSPSHPLLHTVREDVKNYLARIDGKTELKAQRKEAIQAYIMMYLIPNTEKLERMVDVIPEQYNILKPQRANQKRVYTLLKNQ